MHRAIENHLEEYLEGRSSREVDAHLEACAACREEVSAIARVSHVLTSFRSAQPPSPPLGFQARLMRGVAERKTASVWGVFSVDPAFARKLAFGSLLSLAVLGSYLAVGIDDSMAKADHTPEAVLASHDISSPDQQQHRDGMLLTLATYHQ